MGIWFLSFLLFLLPLLVFLFIRRKGRRSKLQIDVFRCVGSALLLFPFLPGTF
jgi:hypothetical protein